MKDNSFLILTLILLVSVALGAGCRSNAENVGGGTKTEKANISNSTVKSEKTTDGDAVRSGKIVAAFSKDKDANRQYRGKTLLISGKITNINSVFDQVNINLRENDAETGLAAYLKEPNDKQKLKVGDEVTIRGMVRDDETGIVEKAEIVRIN